jgi:hypothetical protein
LEPPALTGVASAAWGFNHDKHRFRSGFTIELTPGINYLTLRCISCAAIYDAQVPASPALATALVRRIEYGA